MTDYAGYLSGGNNEFAVCTAVFCRQRAGYRVIELSQSTATVALAAAAHRVEPGQIAKTLSLKVKNEVILVVAKGDARLDNKKLKDTFGAKAHAQQ
jgi:prolyl-tRNA editing enzyme YbaK/EbsC (Cys-tRNA(Pro) deacylase)